MNDPCTPGRPTHDGLVITGLVTELVTQLQQLPPRRIAEVVDYAAFLAEREQRRGEQGDETGGQESGFDGGS